MVEQITSAQFKEKVLEGTGLILVDFSAVWCGPCRMLAPQIEKLAEEKVGELVVYSVDVDTCPDVARNFGISAVPTLVLFKSGQAVRSLTGAQPIESLRAFVEA